VSPEDRDEITRELQSGRHDFAIIVNPNSPTGTVHDLRDIVCESGLSPTFEAKNDHFTKTGLGQTQGELKKADRFCSGAECSSLNITVG